MGCGYPGEVSREGAVVEAALKAVVVEKGPGTRLRASRAAQEEEETGGTPVVAVAVATVGTVAMTVVAMTVVMRVMMMGVAVMRVKTTTTPAWARATAGTVMSGAAATLKSRLPSSTVAVAAGVILAASSPPSAPSTA